MLKIVMEDMADGEIAAMYQEGNDAVILVSRTLDDDTRARAVNRLLGRLTFTAPSPMRLVRSVSGVAMLLLLAHLGEEIAGAAGQGFQTLGV